MNFNLNKMTVEITVFNNNYKVIFESKRHDIVQMVCQAELYENRGLVAVWSSVGTGWTKDTAKRLINEYLEANWPDTMTYRGLIYVYDNEVEKYVYIQDGEIEYYIDHLYIDGIYRGYVNEFVN